ncbi:hypothetical protein INT46_010082 [Mucor plumbeus]|uniref:Uncharacterized protein n=1 Tax=Mucor plumbeus TaxID=97098 RepID=A0A8H7V7B8_9FUNG|nr:hypothetical protein INT46_010082 [Mucor plumbeus]
MDIELGTFLSSGQSVNVLSIDDAPHSEDSACSEDARITRELGEDAFPHYYDDTIKTDSEFDIQFVENEFFPWTKNTIKSSCHVKSNNYEFICIRQPHYQSSILLDLAKGKHKKLFK